MSEAATDELSIDESRERPWWFRFTVTEMKPSWHGVILGTDLEASEPATVDLICMLVAFTKPTVIVESGTYKAHTALAMANTLRQMGQKCMIYTADPLEQGLTKTLEESEWLNTYIRYYHGDYEAMLSEVEGSPNLAYIDGGDRKDVHMRLRHTRATYKRLAPGGVMLVDDTGATDWGDAGILRSMANVYLPQNRGLAIIQKPI